MTAGLVCTVCGVPLSGASHNVSARPRCASNACDAVRQRERRETDPAYAARQRVRSREWAARRAERRAVAVKADGWLTGTGGCGRQYPAGSLEDGTCGGPWCPSGAGAEVSG